MPRDGVLSRFPRWAWAAIAIVVLAAVIGGIAALSAPGRRAAVEAPVTPITASELAAQARAALASGDETGAADLAGRALVLDPNDADARAVRDSLDGADEEPDAPATATPAAAGPWLAAHPPRSLLVTNAAGYSFGTVQASATDAEISGQPTAGSPGEGRIQRVQLSVHDRGSAASAAAFAETVSKKSYAQDVTSADVRGAKAYVATDGTLLAAVEFARGRYVFEVVVTSAGEPPAALRDLAVELARAFPATP
ncbi:MAG: hypothetical protein FDZ70_00095 [Actinobacteria bacterium]|nr:MAG: hypothetical protein FDZ70_00095 [Actinomycetota bacterium]